MQIAPFKVEEWMNKWETDARYNIAETCCDAVSLDELFDITGGDKTAFLQDMCARRLTYGDIEGRPDLKAGICKLYKTLKPDDIITMHGASGANHHLFYSLIRPGERVVSVMPTYQQLYAIPASYSADVKILPLKAENGYLPDLDALKQLVTPETKLICINNPNNPTGALMDKALLRQICAIAEKADAYVLCDEVYRHLTQEDVWSPSVADLYDKGISISSMSKVFSLAGLRIGWMATRDRDVMRESLSHRDYDLISCSVLDEMIAAEALKHADKLIARNRRLVRKNLAILDHWIAGEDRVSYVRPQAGTTALVHYDADIPSYDFCEAMYHQTGAFVTPGDCFEEPHSMRIGYACDTMTLKAGLAAVSDFLRML